MIIYPATQTCLVKLLLQKRDEVQNQSIYYSTELQQWNTALDFYFVAPLTYKLMIAWID